MVYRLFGGNVLVFRASWKIFFLPQSNEKSASKTDVYRDLQWNMLQMTKLANYWCQVAMTCIFPQLPSRCTYITKLNFRPTTWVIFQAIIYYGDLTVVESCGKNTTQNTYHLGRMYLTREQTEKFINKGLHSWSCFVLIIVFIFFTSA